MEAFELSTFALVCIAVAVFAASVISSVTGMAGGVLMFSAMNIFIPLRPLIAVHGVVQIFNNGARVWFLRPAIRWRMCLPFCLGAVLGTLVTTLFIVRFVDELLPLVLLLALIAYSLFKPSQLPAIVLRDPSFLWVGVGSGALGILAGAVDPYLGAFFLRDDLSKEEIVANKSLMQLFTHLTKIPAVIFLGFVFAEHVALIAGLSVVAVLGTRLGVLMLDKIDQQLFLSLMRTALLLVGLRIVYQVIMLLLN